MIRERNNKRRKGEINKALVEIKLRIFNGINIYFTFDRNNNFFN